MHGKPCSDRVKDSATERHAVDKGTKGGQQRVGNSHNAKFEIPIQTQGTGFRTKKSRVSHGTEWIFNIERIYGFPYNKYDKITTIRIRSFRSLYYYYVCTYIYIWYAFDAFACVLGAIYFLGFYMFKIPLFPRCFFSQSSLSGPMRFSHPVDTTDRRNTKVHLGVCYRQY